MAQDLLGEFPHKNIDDMVIDGRERVLAEHGISSKVSLVDHLLRTAIGIPQKTFGTENQRILRSLEPLYNEIGCYIEDYINEDLSFDDIKAKTKEWQEECRELEDLDLIEERLDELLPEAFALHIYTSNKLYHETNGEWKYEKPRPVQVLAGIILHRGKIIDMKTGEGKTFAATFAAYLKALAGKGVHVTTVNNTLARRDKEDLERFYNALGLSVGLIYSKTKKEEAQQTTVEKIKEYNKDIIYGIYSEFGYDFIADNLIKKIENKMQRRFFTIIDEVDSILIDEARTPLILESRHRIENIDKEKIKNAAQLVKHLKEKEDYEVDLKYENVLITDKGLETIENIVESPTFLEDYPEYFSIFSKALRAQRFFRRVKYDKNDPEDKDEDNPHALYEYHVMKNHITNKVEVVPVDKNRHIIKFGQRFVGGLHQALEAKENIEIQDEMGADGSITQKNLCKQYKCVAGMTGTALPAAGEFRKTHNLDTIAIPRDQPLRRVDLDYVIFATKKEKWDAVIKEILRVNRNGQPILVGTTSVEDCECLAKRLEESGEIAKLYVLNGTKDRIAHDTKTIASAGQKYAVTISNNMAGRGTDIVLGEGVKNCKSPFTIDGIDIELGGLYVIGTEVQQSRRIDDQLCGRSGRQGDQGVSRIFISLEDEIFSSAPKWPINLAKKNLKGKKMKNKWFTNITNKRQAEIEASDEKSRKYNNDYDDILEGHRKEIFEFREQILHHGLTIDEDESEHNFATVYDMAEDCFSYMLQPHIEKKLIKETRRESIYCNKSEKTKLNVLRWLDDMNIELDVKDFEENFFSTDAKIKEEDREYMIDYLMDAFREQIKDVKENTNNDNNKEKILSIIDECWLDHFDEMEKKKREVSVCSIARIDPKLYYDALSSEFRKNMIYNIKRDILTHLLKQRYVPITHTITSEHYNSLIFQE